MPSRKPSSSVFELITNCPNTGQPFPTGVKFKVWPPPGWSTALGLTDRCPHCGQRHGWSSDTASVAEAPIK